MKVLVACEFSGTVREAFLARGHDAWSCDLLPDERGSNRHIRSDGGPVGWLCRRCTGRLKLERILQWLT